MQFVGGLDLDHDAIVDDHIETLLAELLTFVHHRDPDLASHFVRSRQQLALESLEVKVLEEAISKGVVNLEKRADYRVNQLFDAEWRSAHPPKSRL